MDVYIEDREYHEKFMREAINMVSARNLQLHIQQASGSIVTTKVHILMDWNRLSSHLAPMKHQSAASLFITARSSVEA